MKTVIFLAVFFGSALTGVTAQTREQPTSKEARFTQLLESRNYEFIPQSAQPAYGRSIENLQNFSLSLYGDSLVCYLPYFGEAYSASPANTDGPLAFTTTKFTCSSEPGKKNRTLVRILLGGGMDAREMTLDISQGGYTTMNVIFNTRQSISFSGSTMAHPGKRK